MSREKGQPKTGGREKGTPNKVTTDLRTWITELINDNRKQLKKDLKKLEPKERWTVVEKLMSYTIPKMQSVEAKIDLNRLSDEQLNTIIAELSKNIENE